MPIDQKNIVDLAAESGGEHGDKKKQPPPPSQASQDRADRDLRTRLEGVFDRIAEAAEVRGDIELADAIAEDAKVMAQGLVSFTRPLRALRGPLLLLLGIVEPFMAFRRVGMLLFGRWYVRRRGDTPETPEPDEPIDPGEIPVT